jgi:hypothetical protein
VKIANGKYDELARSGSAHVARAQKISFRVVEGVHANQIVVGTKVKRERGADNFCLFRRRKWIVAKSARLVHGFCPQTDN